MSSSCGVPRVQQSFITTRTTPRSHWRIDHNLARRVKRMQTGSTSAPSPCFQSHGSRPWRPVSEQGSGPTSFLRVTASTQRTTEAGIRLQGSR